MERSRFLNLLQPGDVVMADHWFKIQDLNPFYQCSLASPPTAICSLEDKILQRRQELPQAHFLACTSCNKESFMMQLKNTKKLLIIL